MWRICAASAGRCAAGGAVTPAGVPSRARPAPSAVSSTGQARSPAIRTVLRSVPSGAISFGRRSATPCEGGAREWTYAQAAHEIGQMAGALCEMGLAPGSKVAISGRNTAHFLLADYAISLAGFVSVGLYPKQSAAHITYILSHCEASVVF